MVNEGYTVRVFLYYYSLLRISLSVSLILALPYPRFSVSLFLHTLRLRSSFTWRDRAGMIYDQTGRGTPGTERTMTKDREIGQRPWTNF